SRLSHSTSFAAMRCTMSIVSALIARGRLRVMRPSWPRSSKSTGESSAVSRSVMSTRFVSALEKVAADDQFHDLVRSLQYLVHAQIAHDFLDAVLRQVPVAAVQLQGGVCGVERNIRRESFRHRAPRRNVGVVV